MLKTKYGEVSEKVKDQYGNISSTFKETASNVAHTVKDGYDKYKDQIVSKNYRHCKGCRNRIE